LVATSEVNGLYLPIEREMILQGHDAEHACRWRKEVEFHSQRLPFLLRTRLTVPLSLLALTDEVIE